MFDLAKEIDKFGLRKGKIFEGRVYTNKRITCPDHWQDVRHITLHFDEAVDYQPGDLISLYPQNHPKDVETFIACMGWLEIADQRLCCPRKDLTRPLTLRTLVTHHLDIMSIPRRSFFEIIAHFSENPQHVEKLREFTAPEGQEQRFDYANRPRRSILEVLAEFDSVKIPLEYLLDAIPLISSRQFSIASFKPNEVHLVVAIVKYRTIIRRIRRGLCTRWLENLPYGSVVPVAFLNGQMRKAEISSKPILLIGPGTGLAPMLALIEERIESNSKGRIILFFGCRYSSKDFIFKEELQNYANDGLLELFTAFSRDNNKEYVQDQMRRNSRVIYEALLVQRGFIYICGSRGRMPSAVKEAVVECLIKEGLEGRDEAESFLSQMELEGRYRQETW